ncbi:MAG TPA: S8 family serine peptidase [Flavobacterium sp.]|nr:S8 family serine peptidase [Flavobacterium sp.]HPJ11452.1 S8 family serine peptidase [Flavobacterium sp.]
MRKILLFLLFLSSIVSAQTTAEKIKIAAHSNVKHLKALSKKYEADFRKNKETAIQLSKRYHWQPSLTDGLTYSELMGVTPDLRPIYFTTYNQGSGITSRASKLYHNGGLGLDIEGQNMTSGLWDAGSALASHEIFSGRLSIMDDCITNRSHSTHVAGTIIGTNQVQGGQARGMAFRSNLHSYDWDNDQAEVALAAANGLLLSNHSYGYNPNAIQDYQWGKYDNKSQAFDEIMFDAPYYQFVCAAGNSRGSFNLPKNGFDLITGQALAKNAITVGSVEELLNYTGPNDVVMASTSSWGPADDGRIKPDIVAKGVNTFSATNEADNSYALASGTSMASASVEGTLLLLQQYNNQRHGMYLRAATLKALMVHTADEAGLHPGPDYRFGWGLINAEKAANTITNKGLQSYLLENTLSQNETFSLPVNAIGNQPLVATLCWTDPKGELHSFNTDDNTPDLVNDLDLRITQNEDAFFPWKLNGDNPAAAATKGDNVVDNIEKSEIDAASGSYVITVSHKGNLTSGLQNYSLVVSGIILKNFWFTAAEPAKSICNDADEVSYALNFNLKGDFNEPVLFSTVGLPPGITADFSPATMTTNGTVNLTLENLTSLDPGVYPFSVKGQSESDVFETTLTLNVLTADFTPVSLQQPLANAVLVNNPVTFRWLADSNAQTYDLQVASDSEFTQIVASASAFLENTFTATLQNDTTYFWRVRSSNQCGQGDFGPPQSFSTTCVLPTNLTLHAIGQTSATIGWTSNSNSWSYIIVPRDTPPGGAANATTTNPVTIQDLLPNTCYDFYFKNTCSFGSPDWSEPFTFCTVPDYCGGDHFYDSGGVSGDYHSGEDSTTVIYPENPGDRVRAVFNSFLLDDCCDYLLVFNGPSETSPFLLLANGDNSPGTIVSTHPTGALTFVFHSSSSRNEFGWDATISCEPLPACPNAPANLQLWDVTTTSALIHWQDDSDAASWEIEIVPHNAVPTGNASSVAATNPFNVLDLNQNNCYDFYVRSICTAGTSNWAGPFSFCTNADYCGGDHFYDSGGPTGDYQNYEYKTTVISPENPGDRIKAIFEDFDVRDDDSFVIYNGPDADAPLLYDNAIDHHNPGTIASTHSSGALTFVFSSDGFHRDHGWDAQIICELLPPCATYPDHIHAENITMSGAKLEWDTNCNPVSWEYELVTQGTAPTGVGIAVADNYQVFSGLNSNTCYDFYIRSICASGNSVWSDAYTFCTKANYCAGDHFYDSGGLLGNYDNDAFETTVIYPDQPGNRVKAIFNSFEVESCCDRLRIYNGPTRNHPLIYNSFSGVAPGTFVSTHSSGALTFLFSSGMTNTAAGWDATIVCEALPQCANPPSGIHLLSVSAESANMGWDENSGATSWEVKIAPRNETPSPFGTVINENSYQFAGLETNSCYDFYVRSVCAEANSSWTKFQFCTEPDYCNGQHFYDSGGPNDHYGNNQDKVTIIYPGNPNHRVRAIFNVYELESCCDYLKIYNGPDTSYPVLYDNAAVSPGSVASTDISGALTFEFHSDDSTREEGWDATIICEPLPDCPNPPTAITVSAIGQTTATLNWMDNADATAWRIELVPHGNMPTGTGTTVLSTTFTYNELHSASCYDFYVQAICSLGNTGWAGPFQFCTDSNYCGGDHFYDSGGASANYSNSENTTTVIYPDNAGEQVTATFLSYNVEGCCDVLQIYNGPDTSYPLLFNGGNASPGLVTSTDSSGALTFVFFSDANSNASGWDAQINCTNLHTNSPQPFTVLEYYPNPVSRLLTVNAHEKVSRYAVFSIDGKLLREVKIDEVKFEIDLQQFPSGSYFIKLINEKSKSRILQILKR